MSTVPGVNAERRRRPKDRKAQIARVSAEAFSELGYHGLSMEDIAGRVGVTAASLYRHYAGKYDLFRAAVLGLGQQLVDGTAFAEDHDAVPEQAWDRVVAALVDVTLKNRASGGLYRWEGRYLDSDDQAVLNDQIKLVNRRLQRPLRMLRPGLDSRQRWTLSSSVLSVIGSITDHNAHLAPDRIHAVLTGIARDVRDTDLPRRPESRVRTPVRVTVGADAGEYEQILHAAMLLFNERGYRDTGMEDIAAAVDISTTTIYRFFAGKAAILAAAYRRAADRVSGDLVSIIAASEDARDTVDQLIDAYVRRSFANPELAYVYYAERVNVPAEDQLALHNIQRATVDAWARQVAAVRPDMSAEEARFAVHAGFALVVDLGRLMDYTNTELALESIRHLMHVTLLGDSAKSRRKTRRRVAG
jgi:AcrR family transcriptional regulator